MDFGVGFLSNNVMLPILDFFYGIVPSYGLAIIALTLVIRLALFPLSAGSIRNMRQMKYLQPKMAKAQEQIRKLQETHQGNPAKLQEEMGKFYKEQGLPNPGEQLSKGCLPVLLQMPILFALFATLRGSPFADVRFPVNLQILPQDQIQQIQPQTFSSKPQNIFVADGVHYAISAVAPGGTRLGVGQKTNLELQTPEGKPLSGILANYPDSEIKPRWEVLKGSERVKINESGNIEALQAGDVTLQGTIPGLAADKGFLFINALGRVGAIDGDLMQTTADGGKTFNFSAIHWDVLVLILGFGASLYVSQLISGQGSSTNPQQSQVNTMLPVIFSGMFLFFPLPAGVLLYMLVANIIQTAQTFIISREPLPENIQKLLDEEKKAESMKNRGSLPFEPGQPKGQAKGAAKPPSTPPKKKA
jgi:YidC/Oxa1 family membrane protein insertase